MDHNITLKNQFASVFTNQKYIIKFLIQLLAFLQLINLPDKLKLRIIINMILNVTLFNVYSADISYINSFSAKIFLSFYQMANNT